MKTYKIEIIYTEEPGKKSMETFVNGKKAPLPKGIKKWIAEDVVREMFYTFK